MLRDPINVSLGLAFPLVVMLLLWFINRSIPAQANMGLYEIASMTPGIVVFGYSFVTLFSATLIAKDRGSAFLPRLFASPMRAGDFILGYTLPMLPLALGQTLVCYAAAMLLGLSPDGNMLLSIVVQLPCAVMYIATGLLVGSLLNDRQVGGVCGALLTNLTAWLSGAWFSLDLVGGGFRTVAYCLPFANAVDVGRLAIRGTFGAEFWQKLAIVCAYALLLSVLAVAVFRKAMSRK